MSLQPVDGVLSAIVKVAQVDEDAARELVRLGLYESLSDQIEVMRPRLDLDALDVMAERVGKARQVMATMVNKAEAQTYNEHLDVIEDYINKSLFGDVLALFNQQHPRNDKGQFVSARVGQNLQREMEAATRQNVVHNEALQHAQRWVDSGLAGPDTPVKLHYKPVDHMTGNNRRGQELELDSTIGNLAQDLDRNMRTQGARHRLTHLSIARSNITANNPGDPRERAAFDVMAGLTGANTDSARFAHRTLRHLPQKNPYLTGDTATNWNRVTNNGDRQSYRRLSMTGRALSSISENGSTMDTIGGMAALIGDLGPEAEKVLGPGIRRTAYRYRGTERRPDKALLEQMKEANRSVDELEVGPDNPAAGDRRDQEKARLDTATRQDKGKQQTATRVLNYYAQEPFDGMERDQRELAVRGDVAAAWLIQHDAIPVPKSAELSIESGELPPSQGILINYKGQVVSQSQGYNGDHYLPFDLKNLGQLFGGQYVRTRVAGGPTTEDIYTGLMSGARQIQVVSNSGVFTVQFDPDLRGGRRYSDKAKRMVNRYAHLLDEVANGNHYLKDVDQSEQAELRRTAYASANYDAKLGGANFDDALKRRRLQEQFAGMSDEEIDDMVREEVDAKIRASGRPRPSRADYAAMIEHERAKAKQVEGEQRVRPLRLDGPGYQLALESLKQEFPYYIRSVDFQPLPEFEKRRDLTPAGPRGRSGADPGYVRPGGTNPPGMPKAFIKPAGEEPTTTTAGGEAAGGAGGGVTPPAAGAARGAAGPSTVPAVRGHVNVAVPGRREDFKLLAEMAGANSPTSRLVANKVNGLLKPIQQVMDHLGIEADPQGMNEADAESITDNIGYLQWWAVHKGAIQHPENFANWLMTDATPGQLNRFIDAFDQMNDTIPNIKDREGNSIADTLFARAGGETAYRDAIDEVKDLVNLGQPFAEVPEGTTEEQMTMTRPDTGAPKPQPIPEIVARGAKVDSYDAYLEAAQTQDPGFVQAYDQVKTKSINDIVAEINSRIDAIEDPQVALTRSPMDTMTMKNDLERLQRAWAFKAARHMAETLEHTRVPTTGGGAAPLAQPSQPPQQGQQPPPAGPGPVRLRKRQVPLEWLDPRDPQAQAVSKALGLWRGRVQGGR